MVAINFQERFAEAVECGAKRQTIRRQARCKPGDALQLYTGQRTKECRKLLDTVCTSVTPIRIEYMGIIIDGKPLPAGWANRGETEDYDCDFALKDGFDDFQEMADWFQDRYGLPFSGYLIKW